MMKTPSYLLMIATAALIGPGCKTVTVNSVEPAQPTAQREPLQDKRVITDSSLDNKVHILGINQATGPGGFLKIQVDLQNTTRHVQSFTYQVEWFDENSMIIRLPTQTAKPRALEGKEIISITATAPTPNAKDFRIKFLEPTN